MNIAHRTKTVVINDAAVAATSTITGTTIDMAGYRGLLIIAFLGDVTVAATPWLKALQGTDSGGSGATAIAGSSILAAAGASNYDLKVMQVDVYRPQYRYITAQLLRTAANVVLNGIIGILYDPIDEPTTQVDAISSQVLADPAA